MTLAVAIWIALAESLGYVEAAVGLTVTIDIANSFPSTPMSGGHI